MAPTDLPSENDMANPYKSPQADDALDSTTTSDLRRAAPARKVKLKYPHCGHNLKGATTAMIGDLAVCPHCKAEFEIRPPYMTYEQVPWYRRSGVNSVFILVHILTGGCVPFILWTCVNLVTGDIYYKKKDAAGYLQTRSFANKVVAVAILLVNAIVLLLLLLGPSS